MSKAKEFVILLASIATIVACIFGIILAVPPFLIAWRDLSRQSSPTTIGRTPTSIPVVVSTPTGLPVLPTQVSPTGILPTRTNVAPTSIITSPPLGKVLFTDDFEDGKATKWSVKFGNWDVIADETGNHVYRGTGADLWGYTVAGDNDWTNYVLEVRVKGVSALSDSNADTAWAILTTRTIWGTGCFGNKFQLGFSNGYVALGKMGDNCDTTFPNAPFFKPQMGRWYQIRYEVFTSTQRVYIDNNLLLQAQDNQLKQGYIGLAIGSQATCYFDDIRVTELLP